MALSWKKRLRIPLKGNSDPKFFTKSGTHIATGYFRVVIGGRGPYVEFAKDQIVWWQFFVPDDQIYRWHDERVYYVEYRSRDDSSVKLYFQKRKVAYADYKKGMVYISPFDLFTYGKTPIVV